MFKTEDLAIRIGINHSFLLSLILNADKFYYSYYILKRSKKKRIIDAPSVNLKGVQSWILRKILENIRICDRAYGFVKKRGIKNNARVHLGNKYVLCIDIANFFNSTTEKAVHKVFDTLPEYSDISNSLTKLCVFRGYLPQGAVTSPYLSNIIFSAADTEILRLCNKRNVEYSRYADDLTFSSNDLNKLKEIHIQVEKICNANGYELNKSKSRYMSGKKRVSVTGLVLNSQELSIGRERKREIRSMMFNYIIKKDKTININALLGSLAFLRDIEPNTYKNFMRYKTKLKQKIII